MKKITLVYILLLFPLFFFSQRKIEDFFNNKIDFVLDNDYGRSFMGNVVSEYIKTDSTNHFYNKTGIQPFYRYIESDFFDKKFLKENGEIITDKKKSKFEYNHTIDLKTHDEYNYLLDLNKYRSFNINSVISGDYQGLMIRKSYYEPFKNFELNFDTHKKKEKQSINKSFYSNACIIVNGMSLFEKESISGMSFYNTITINYTDCKNCTNCKNKDECISFSVIVYETIGMNGPYVKVDKNHIEHHYIGTYPDIVMRKVEITGNKEEAIKYLKENKLDYTEIKPEGYKEDFFKKKANR